MSVNYTLTPAAGTLTSTGAFTDTQTVVVGGKTYTTQTTLTDVDGNVLIGADAEATHQNLFDAINLTGTAGTQYAASMTANTRVKATGVSATTTVVTALTPGEVGNLIASTETQTNASWGGSVLAGGAGNFTAWVAAMEAATQMPSSVIAHLHSVTATLD